MVNNTYSFILSNIVRLNCIIVMYSGSVVGWIISTKGNICPYSYEKANSLLNLQNKSKFLAHLKSPFSSMKRKAPSMGNKKKWLMFCLLFLTPCSRTAMAIAGFKVNQSNFGQTSLSSQSWVEVFLTSWTKDIFNTILG